MESSLKQRLVGAVVLVALAVIFLPMLVKGPAPDSGVSDVSLTLPKEPASADGMVTQDLPLVAPAAAPEGGATGMPGAMTTPADAAAPAAGANPTAIAAGDYAVSFGSYASAGDADLVLQALRDAGLRGYREAVTLNGRPAQRVRIGPFADRAQAESARLQAGDVRSDVDARVVTLDAASTTAAAMPAATAKPASTPVATVAAPQVKLEPLPPAPKPVPVEPKSAAKPAEPVAAAPKPAVPAAAKPAPAASTGFAVQVGAFAAAAEATKLRDRIRAAGLNAFTETVPTDKGTLTRVRVGPVVSRAEADALKAQVKAKAGIDGFVRPHP